MGEGIDDKWNWRKDILYIILNYGSRGKSIGITRNKKWAISSLKMNVIFWQEKATANCLWRGGTKSAPTIRKKYELEVIHRYV